MIKSFVDKDVETLFKTKKAPAVQLVNIQSAAFRKLMLLHAAKNLSDLETPAGNRLHALKGNREGQHSITVPGGFRICFKWKADGVHDIEIINYH